MKATYSRLATGIAAMLILAIVAGGCGTSSSSEDTTAVTIDMTDEALRPVYSTWVNMPGLNQYDRDIWRARLSEACTLGV